MGLNILVRYSMKRNLFDTARLSALNLYVIFSEIESFSKKRNQCLVGFAFLRNSSNLDPQRISLKSHKFCSAAAGNDFDGDLGVFQR